MMMQMSDIGILGYTHAYIQSGLHWLEYTLCYYDIHDVPKDGRYSGANDVKATSAQCHIHSGVATLCTLRLKAKGSDQCNTSEVETFENVIIHVFAGV